MGAELDIKTFNLIFNRYQQRFCCFATSYVSDRDVAEDIVMESFEASWEQRARLTEETFPAYMMTVVKNRCLNHLRSRYIKVKAADQINSHNAQVLATRISTLQACDPDELFGEESQRLVNDALAKLPERTRRIFVRSRFDGQSYKQIAEETGCTVKSVEFEISKAIKVLRVALKDYLVLLIMLDLS